MKPVGFLFISFRLIYFSLLFLLSSFVLSIMMGREGVERSGHGIFQGAVPAFV
jgi:hypothetical protein